MPRRTRIQLALVVIGLIVWGASIRLSDDRLGVAGIGFFAAATVLRFAKRRDHSEPGELSDAERQQDTTTPSDKI